VEFYWGVPITGYAQLIYTLTSLALLLGSILTFLGLRIGKYLVVFGLSVALVIYDNPLLHIDEKIMLRKMRLAFIDIVAILLIINKA